MKRVLVTGGTVFVSRYIAEYYVTKGYEVYVLNRNTKEQSKGVNLIQADRHEIGDAFKDTYFDIVIDTVILLMMWRPCWMLWASMESIFSSVLVPYIQNMRRSHLQKRLNWQRINIGVFMEPIR